MSAPSVVQAPAVTISIASVIGRCDDLIVDLTSSMGSGGRLGVCVICGVGFKSERLIGARLSEEWVGGECLVHFFFEISLLDSSRLVELRLRLHSRGQAVQFLGRLWIESQELCGVVVSRSASAGVEFAEPDLCLQKQHSLNLWRWLHCQLWCEKPIILDLQLVCVREQCCCCCLFRLSAVSVSESSGVQVAVLPPEYGLLVQSAVDSEALGIDEGIFCFGGGVCADRRFEVCVDWRRGVGA
jgi:hypothetical protein